MLIFHSNVCLPEGNQWKWDDIIFVDGIIPDFFDMWEICQNYPNVSMETVGWSNQCLGKVMGQWDNNCFGESFQMFKFVLLSSQVVSMGYTRELITINWLATHALDILLSHDDPHSNPRQEAPVLPSLSMAAMEDILSGWSWGYWQDNHDNHMGKSWENHIGMGWSWDTYEMIMFIGSRHRDIQKMTGSCGLLPGSQPEMMNLCGLRLIGMIMGY